MVDRYRNLREVYDGMSPIDHLSFRLPVSASDLGRAAEVLVKNGRVSDLIRLVVARDADLRERYNTATPA